MEIATVTPDSSMALKKYTQFNIRNTPQIRIRITAGRTHFSRRSCPDFHQKNPKNNAAQRQRIKTNSKGGTPLLWEKKPTDPKRIMAIDIFVSALRLLSDGVRLVCMLIKLFLGCESPFNSTLFIILVITSILRQFDVYQESFQILFESQQR